MYIVENKDRTPRKKQPEIYLLLFLGYTPQEIVNLGYSEATTYKYNREFPKIKQNLKNVLSTKALSKIAK